MKKIFKYILEITDEQELILPMDSKILSVKEQYGDIVVYALVNTSIKGIEGYSFIIHGTGHNTIENIDNYIFLGTVKLKEGALMFHVFYDQKDIKSITSIPKIQLQFE